MTVSDIARRKGVSKQAVAKRIDRFSVQGLISTRPGPRGAKLVNLAEYDKVTGEASDAIREMNATTRGPVAAPGDPVLAKEQARRVAYQADLAKLDLDERLGKLIPVAEVEQAMVRSADAVIRVIERLPRRADDLAAAVAREGAAGVRGILKEEIHNIRTALARELRLLADETEEEKQGNDEV